MSAPLTEFTIETVIRDGLGNLRANPIAFDDLFSKFRATFFNNQYGQDHINTLKTYIQNNQVRIVHSFAQVPPAVPCVSIQILKSSETPKLQQFSNEAEDVDTPIEPIVRIADVQPLSYDPVSGKLQLDPDTDLSNLCPGMIFKDSNGIEFTIRSGNSNLAGNKYINIGPGQEPELTLPGKITSNIRNKRMSRRMIRLEETISLGVHAKNNVHIVKYLYYILTYILKSRMDSLINRGVHLDYGIGSIFDRVDEYQGENVFSRFIEVNCITEFDWDQEQVSLIDCFDLTVRAPDGVTPTSTTKTSPTDS
jgi:hypothetical protein